MKVAHIDDLSQSGVQQVVQPGREDHDPQADGRAGQSVGHNRLDGVAARRAPVATDCVLGHDRRDSGGKVFDDPSPRRLARTNRPMTLGAGPKRVLLPAVDPRWRRPSRTGVSRLGPLGLGPPPARRLDVRRSLSRRCRRIGQHREGLFLGELFGQSQKREDNRILALLEDERGLLGDQSGTENCLQGSRVEGVHTLGCKDEGDRLLVLAAITAMLRPVAPPPILVINGGLGTAKTTSQRVIKELIDPDASDSASPEEERDLHVWAESTYLINIDK